MKTYELPLLLKKLRAVKRSELHPNAYFTKGDASYRLTWGRTYRALRQPVEVDRLWLCVREEAEETDDAVKWKEIGTWFPEDDPDDCPHWSCSTGKNYEQIYKEIAKRMIAAALS